MSSSPALGDTSASSSPVLENEREERRKYVRLQVTLGGLDEIWVHIAYMSEPPHIWLIYMIWVGFERNRTTWTYNEEVVSLVGWAFFYIMSGP